MTNPTADAIAALTPIFERLDTTDAVWLRVHGETNDAGTIAVPITIIREVRSALLSAQGQAGKPVEPVSNSYKLATARTALEATRLTLLTAIEAPNSIMRPLVDEAVGQLNSALATIKGLET